MSDQSLNLVFILEMSVERTLLLSRAWTEESYFIMMNFLSSKVRPNEEDEESKVEDSAIGM